MTPSRFRELQFDDSKKLTAEEIAEGWHFCYEMDELLCVRGGIDCCCEYRLENE